MLGDEIEQRPCGLHHLNLAGGGVDDIVVNQCPLRSKHHHLAAGSESGIDGEHALLAQGGSKHEVFQIF